MEKLLSVRLRHGADGRASNEMSKKSKSECRGMQFPNGLTLATCPTTNNPYLLPCGDLLQILHDNVGRIVDLVQDVFIHSTDLILLDYQHGLFGGGSKVLPEDELAKLPDAEEEIRDCLCAIRPQIPRGWIDWGNYYFLPALTMTNEDRQGFACRPPREQLEIAYVTKREFVKGGGYEKPSVLSWSDWWSRFPLKEHGSTSVDLESESSICCFNQGVVSEAFWLERVLDRKGEDRLLLDSVDRDKIAAHVGGDLPNETVGPEIQSIVEEAYRNNGMSYYGSHPSRMA